MSEQDVGYQTMVELLKEQYEKGPPSKPGPFSPPTGGVPLPGMARPSSPKAPPPVPPRPGRPPGAGAWKPGSVPKPPSAHPPPKPAQPPTTWQRASPQPGGLRGRDRAGEHRAFQAVFEAQQEMVANLFKNATLRYKSGKSLKAEIARSGAEIAKTAEKETGGGDKAASAGKSRLAGSMPSRPSLGAADAFQRIRSEEVQDLGSAAATSAIGSIPTSGKVRLDALGKAVFREVGDLTPGELSELAPFIGEIAGDVFADLGASMIPILKDVRSGAKVVSQWVDTGKKAMAASKAERAGALMQAGDPQAAVQAVVGLLKVERNRLAAEAGIETGKFAVGISGYFADLGTASAAAVSVTTALAKLGIKIHGLVKDARELKAGRAALSAGRFDRELFAVCPILGAYVVTCTDTSYMVGLVNPPGRHVGLDELESVIRKHLHPLQREARGLIEVSRLTVEGAASNKGQFRPSSDYSYVQRVKASAKKKFLGAFRG